MGVIAMLLVAVVALALFFGVSCRRATAVESTPVAKTEKVTVEKMAKLTPQEVDKMLSDIERGPTPQSKMGAMCYEMAAPPERVEYVCPTCQERTLYRNIGFDNTVREIPSCRREFEALKKVAKVDVALDEKSFCRKCSPDAKEQKLVLTLKYADGTTRTVSPVTWQDLRILTDFFSGKQTWKTSNDGEEPLKGKIKRLREMLGEPEKKE